MTVRNPMKVNDPEKAHDQKARHPIARTSLRIPQAIPERRRLLDEELLVAHRRFPSVM